MFRKVCDSVHINPCLRLAKCLSTIKERGVEACLFKQARKFVPKDHREIETAGKIGAGADFCASVTPNARGMQMLDGELCMLFSSRHCTGTDVKCNILKVISYCKVTRNPLLLQRIPPNPGRVANKIR